jgi:hypothetical protein
VIESLVIQQLLETLIRSLRLLGFRHEKPLVESIGWQSSDNRYKIRFITNFTKARSMTALGGAGNPVSEQGGGRIGIFSDHGGQVCLDVATGRYQSRLRGIFAVGRVNKQIALFLGERA